MPCCVIKRRNRLRSRYAWDGRQAIGSFRLSQLSALSAADSSDVRSLMIADLLVQLARIVRHRAPRQVISYWLTAEAAPTGNLRAPQSPRRRTLLRHGSHSTPADAPGVQWASLP